LEDLQPATARKTNKRTTLIGTPYRLSHAGAQCAEGLPQLIGMLNTTGFQQKLDGRLAEANTLSYTIVFYIQNVGAFVGDGIGQTVQATWTISDDHRQPDQPAALGKSALNHFGNQIQIDIAA